MFEILQEVGKKQLSSGKTLSVVKARCLTCGSVLEMLRQNAIKSNRLNRQHCTLCISDTFHRLTNTRIWRIWYGLKFRTKDKNDKNYGGRGISLCLEWESFSKFYEDMSEGYSDHLTIERIDVNKSYCKENCRWATNMEQQSNKRNNRLVQYQGETLHLAEVCRRSGVSKMKMLMRLNRGMTGDEAVRDALSSPYGKSQRQIDIRRREKRMSSISSTADLDTSS